MKMWNKIKKDAEAISPVVATLMLVLVAVASATAFYLWQSGWQSSVQDNIGDGVGVQTSLVVAGSSTVFEYMTPAAAAYMDANPNYVISVQNVGSGAGIEAIGQDKCDIGMASRALKDVEMEAYPNLVQTTIAFDGIVMIMNDDLYLDIQACGVVVGDLDNLNSAIALGIYAGTISNVGQLALALHPGATADATLLVTYDRADESGTEDGFAEFILGNKNFFKTTPADESVIGNQGMIDAILGDDAGIGFASYGMAKAVSELTYLGFNNVMPDEKSIKRFVVGAEGAQYEASRPLVVITNGEPQGDVKTFVDFILQPANNVEFCAEAGFVSYTVNLF